MKILEGRSTSIEIPNDYVKKIEKYIQSDAYLDSNISRIVEHLVHIGTVSKYTPYHHSEGGERVYINQKAYREFIAEAKKKGYKNGLECLKDLIDEKEIYALRYGNEKKPKENPWATEIGGEYINLAKEVGMAIAGDSEDYRKKLTNYIVNQLVKKCEGNETDIYQVNGEGTSHKIKNNPFEKGNVINTIEFLNWLEEIVNERLKFLETKRYEGYMWEEDAYGGLGLNLNLPHSFSRMFIVIDNEEITEEISKKINDICRMENEINAGKLFSVNIHMIVTMSRDKMYEITDGKSKRSFLDFMTVLLETDGQDIEKGEEVAISTKKKAKREKVNTGGLFY